MGLLFLNLDPLGDYFGFTGGVILGLLWNCIWSQVYALKCEPPAFYLFLVYIPITYVAFAFGGILLNKSTYLFQHNNVASSIILLTYVGAKWLFVFFLQILIDFDLFAIFFHINIVMLHVDIIILHFKIFISVMSTCLIEK